MSYTWFMVIAVKPDSFTFRLPAAIKAALEEAAKEDMRSMASLLVKILAEWLTANGKLNKETKK